MIFNQLANKIKKSSFTILIFSLAVLIKIIWSGSVAWKEDQATNMWIALTKGINDVDVGLLSSKLIPNPNGMIILAKFLLIFENLIIISLFLTLLQSILFIKLIKKFDLSNFDRNLLYILILFSFVLNHAAVDFWNNWIIININILFYIQYFNFKNKPTLNKLILLFSLAFLPCSIYLAAIVNTGIFLLFIFFAIYKCRKKILFKVSFNTFVSVSTLFIQFIFIWIPYFKAININDLRKVSNLSTLDRFEIFLESIFEFPKFFLQQFTNESSFWIPITNYNYDTINVSFLGFRLSTSNLYKLFADFHKIIIFIFLINFLSILSKFIRNKDFELISSNFNITLLGIAYIFFWIILNPTLGGPKIISFERVEASTELYPIYLLIWFLSFNLIKNNNKFLVLISRWIFSIFIIINISLSVTALSERFFSNTFVITEAEVPVIRKYQIAEFIYNDYVNKNLNFSVSYQIGGGIWDWIPSHSESFSKWYADYPFTIGRSFDYIFYTKYNIINAYEGENSRSFNNSLYIISFLKDKPIYDNSANYEEYNFWQYRVSIRNS